MNSYAVNEGAAVERAALERPRRLLIVPESATHRTQNRYPGVSILARNYSLRYSNSFPLHLECRPYRSDRMDNRSLEDLERLGSYVVFQGFSLVS